MQSWSRDRWEDEARYELGDIEMGLPVAMRFLDELRDDLTDPSVRMLTVRIANRTERSPVTAVLRAAEAYAEAAGKTIHVA